jgi:hypothetical protein
MADQIKESFEFYLNSPVSYHKAGEEEKSYQLTLYAPKGKHRQELIRLKQGFLKAITSLQNMSTGQARAEAEEQQGIGSQEIVMALMMSDVDMNKYFEDFKALLCKDVCYVDSNQKMTEYIYNNMDLEDLERLLGEYLSNFLLSSWIERLNRT